MMNMPQKHMSGHNLAAHHLPPSDYHHHSRSGSEEEEESASMGPPSAGSRFFYGILYTISQFFLIGTIVLFVYWVVIHDKGFAWQNDRGKMFNSHALLMLVGFIFLNGQAMLVYKSFQCCRRIYNKIVHTVIFVVSVSSITFGLLLGFQAQDMVGSSATAKHFYSLHSWIGLLTVGLFALQFVVGFISFLVLLCCEKGTARYRANLLPTHRTFGLIIFSLAASACVTGILQTARFRLSGKDGKPDYKDLNEWPTLIINGVGACVIGLAVILPYIIRNTNQRPPLVSSYPIN